MFDDSYFILSPYKQAFPYEKLVLQAIDAGITRFEVVYNQNQEECILVFSSEEDMNLYVLAGGLPKGIFVHRYVDRSRMPWMIEFMVVHQIVENDRYWRTIEKMHTKRLEKYRQKNNSK